MKNNKFNNKSKFNPVLYIGFLIIFIIIFSTLFLLNTYIVLAGDGEGGAGTVTLPNPLGGTDASDINVLIGQVINGVLGVVGSLALIMFIYGGFTWMTAAGSSEKVTKGKDILVWAVIGLIIIFMSYAFVRLILADILGGSASG